MDPRAEYAISIEIQRLKRTIKAWTKVGVKDELQVVQLLAELEENKEMKDELLEELSKVMDIKDGSHLEGLLDGKSCKITLEALLAHHIFLKILAVPFFFLEKNP